METLTSSTLGEEHLANMKEKLDAATWKLEKSGAQWTKLPDVDGWEMPIRKPGNERLWPKRSRGNATTDASLRALKATSG